MMRGLTTPTIAVLLLMFCMAANLNAQATSETTENPARHILERVQKLPASSIERRLPRQRFELWLQNAIGTKTPLDWQISDCGAPTESMRDVTMPLPTCVEAEATLANGRTVVVVLDASSMTDTSGQPTVHWISIEDPDGNVDVQSLKDLQRMLKMKVK
jgi:hypothetical protein